MGLCTLIIVIVPRTLLCIKFREIYDATGPGLARGPYPARQMKGNFSNGPGRHMTGDFLNGPVRAGKKRNEFFNGRV